MNPRAHARLRNHQRNRLPRRLRDPFKVIERGSRLLASGRFGLFYILRGLEREVVQVDHDTPDEMIAWAQWWEEPSNRIIARDEIEGVCVSTVFLGINHGMPWNELPVLFETMVFPPTPGADHYQERHCTLDEARAGHARIVAEVKVMQEQSVTDAQVIISRLRSEE